MDGRNSPSLSLRQQQEMDYQQHQLQQQQILAQHSRSRPSSIYQTNLTSSSTTPTATSPYQSHFNLHPEGSNGYSSPLNGGGVGGGGSSMSMGGMSPSTSAPPPSLQSLQESMAAKERAQTVALMKERLARMKTQTLTSSQLALQQFHQQQASGPEQGQGNNGNGHGGSGNQYF